MTERKRKKIALLSFSPLAQDARVLREAAYLSREHDVLLIGYAPEGFSSGGPARVCALRPEARLLSRGRKALYLPLGRALPAWAYEAAYWQEPQHRQALQVLLGSRAGVIHAVDWEGLVAAVRAADHLSCPVVLDLPEYSPAIREHRWYWKTFYAPMADYFLRRYAGRAALSLTVNTTIAGRYEQVYGFRPQVILNAPEVKGEVPFRPVDPRAVQLVHHGAAIRDRQIEGLIAAVPLLDTRYHLNLILVERSRGYLDSLKRLADRLAPGRVHFHPPVAPQEIVARLGEFDLGLHILPPVNFNFYATLPNKFFEYIAAGLAVCVNDAPEVTRLVGQYGCGAIAPQPTPQGLAQALNSLTPAGIERMKRNSLQARQALNAEVEMGKLLDLYAQLDR